MKDAGHERPGLPDSAGCSPLVSAPYLTSLAAAVPFYPTCSQYALTALRRFGALRGTILAVLRLLRCTPFNNGGIDDVPQRFSIFYRFPWSKAHEEARLTPMAPDKETA